MNTTNPVTKAETITLTRDEVEALYVKGATVEAYSGSDEWDLNDAFQNGFIAALDVVRGHRKVEDVGR